MKLRFILLLLVLPVLSEAQYDRFILVEWFTNTYCGICSSKNPGLQEIYNAYDQGLHRLTIHPNVPYPQCSLFNFNPEDNSSRQDYYNVGATPTLFLNGEGVSTSSPLSFADGVNARLGQTSPISVRVEEFAANQVKISIQSASNLTGDYRLFVAVVEKHLDFNAPNGEDEHFDVLRDFASSVEGDPVSLPQAGEMKEWTYSYTIPDGVSAEEAYILAFVQNQETREILNSGTRFDEVTTGLNDFAREVRLTVYPNPATDDLRVTAGDGTKIHSVDLYDQSGQLVRSLTLNTPDENLSLPVSDLPSGTYILQLDLSGKMGSIQFVKK